MTIYGEDVNNPGSSLYPRFSVKRQVQIKDALVVDVVTNETHPRYAENGNVVGEARIKMFVENESQKTETLSWALPDDTTIQQYPLVGEVVSIRYVGKLPYYSKKINITNNISSGVSSTITAISGVGLNNTSNPTRDALLTSRGVRSGELKQSVSQALSTNITFPTVRSIRASEGDTIIQGRFGNFIRLGSNLFSNPSVVIPQPNLIISVGQNPIPDETSAEKSIQTPLVYEDINLDRSSIWVVSDDRIDINPATQGTPVHLRGSEITRNMPYYTGAQIFINSDRLVLNSKRNEISLFAKTEINLSALKAITISSGDTVFISSDAEVQIEAKDDIFLKASNVSIKVSNNLDISTKGTYSILGEKIFIGAAGDTTQPMVLGGTLSLWLQNLMDLFIDELPKSFATLNPTPFLLEVARLRTMLGTPLTPQSAVFNSKHNFTAKENKV